MTIEEAIKIINKEYLCVKRDCNIERNCGKCDLAMPSKEPILLAYSMALSALEDHARTMKMLLTQPLVPIKYKCETNDCPHPDGDYETCLECKANGDNYNYYKYKCDVI